MKAKYIEERFPADPFEEVVDMETYIELRDFLIECCLAFDKADPESFNRFYYGV